MRTSRRVGVAIGLLVALAIVAAGGWWYQQSHLQPAPAASGVTAVVTSGADRGPGSLREALFVVASAKEGATISLQVPRIVLETALPPIVTAHGLSIAARQEGTEIDAKGLMSSTVLDIAAPNTSIEGVRIRNCSGAAVLLRAARFRLTSSAIDACDVGVDVAENAGDVLLERNRFANDRIGVRFAGSLRNTSVGKNEFSNSRDAAIWAVRSAPDSAPAPIAIRDNKLTGDRTGMVVGNISVLIERNEVINAREAAVHLVGAGAVVRGNRITGGAAMGIVAENARAAVIENNELDGITAYGIMVRGSGNTLVRSNRMHNCGYGMAFVLGDAQGPSTAVENTVIQPKFNGIDVIGDSPILRRNQVLRPHALALHVEDFQPPKGAKITSRPYLDNNTFGAPDTAGALHPKAVVNSSSAR
ncbi:MAG TPA: right-handed parallel beta-helix repeat-containing protein [Steroidobacteraceae bacterium]|jgi:parallel beta-helix repeat protein|nr:right-handed parallel beta-helix repeat-containing protein [Steroidobacteraceae bacterium]